MKVAIAFSSVVLLSSLGFSQEPQRPAPARPAAPAQRGAEAARPQKPELLTREGSALVEAILDQCQSGDLRCAFQIAQATLNDPKSTPGSKEAAQKILKRIQNAMESQSAAKEEPERQRIGLETREKLVKMRMATADTELEDLRRAAHKEREEGRLTEEGLRARIAQAEAARKALAERFQRGAAPRNDRAPAPPRPTGGGTRG